MNCIGQASWKTKEDVLQDLSAIGQSRINDYQVIGERPPPLREHDDEYELRFGGTSYSDEPVAPDLNGITKWLRMVDQSDDEEEPIPQHNGPIVISKLNPLVSEFVPRASSSNSQRLVGENTKSPRKSPKSSAKAAISVTKSPRTSPKTAETALQSSQGNVNGTLESSLENRIESPPVLQQDNKIVKSVTNSAESPSASTQLANQTVNGKKSNKDITVPSISREIAEKTNELRNKISDFKVDSPKHRIQRNVAIANLLKLHSAKPSPSTSKSNLSTSTEEKELKLITPDYFIKNTKDISIAVDDEKIVINEKVDDTVVDNNVDDDKVADENDACVDTKSIQESIDKVNNWFEKPKSPVVSPITKTTVSLSMGPLAFKRKEANGKSPNGSTVDTKVSKGGSAVAQFKPSKYADDLAKKYMERSQAKERQGMPDMWDNLEKELKLKDEEIRKKRAMQDRNL